MTNTEQIHQLEQEFEAIRLANGSIERQIEILKQIKELKENENN